MTHKKCPKCNTEKSTEDFNKNKARSDGLNSYCRDCSKDYNKSYLEKTKEVHNKRQAKWKENNPEKRALIARKHNLMRYYGITPEKYEELLESQGGCCFVCERHHTQFKRKLSVDHSHVTGEIFGLLCDYCNRYLIGRDREPEKFLRAAEYLSKGTGLFVPEKFLKGPKRRRKKKVKK